ncbi:potassium channel family protein [Paraoerskovia marina]|uniref:potassium channel family protein n=1 Tax=Paraoerskovia marina TaxID=545619 RepID=UPI0006946BE8|nr:potassium channel family protein [Paraoerskovia marina]
MPEKRIFDDSGPFVDRFGILLVMTAGTTALLALVDVGGPLGGRGTELATTATAVVVGATLLVALRSAGLSRRWQRATDLAVATVVALVVGGSLVDLPGNVSADATSPILALLGMLAPIVVVRRLLRHRSVGMPTLTGAVAAYLLIPLAFYYAFLTVEQLSGTPFFGSDQPTTVFMYFSLTTITTIGYGDFAAVTPLGRLLAVGEGVVGQLYLVTFVAFIVGLASARVSDQ